ncbi:hypothetical protein CMZ84_05705 [Lysobacteraceae bacterium NML93-0399]|nr:hypothetical protein CMZ84_05705 [Xanthomonadaceae bacterium NML93-0399]
MKIRTTLIAAALTVALAACNNQDPANDTTGVNTETTAVEQGIGADRADTAGTTGQAGAAGMTGATGMDRDVPAAGQLADADRKALMTVEEVDRHEVAAAEDALAKNVEGEVRSYAETLRDDHSRNLEATRNLMAGGTTGSYATGAAATPAARGTTEPAAGSGAGHDAAHGGAAGTAMRDGQPADAELRAMRDKHETERQRLAAMEGDAFAKAWVDAMAKGHQEALDKLDAMLPGVTDEDVANHLRETRKTVASHLETARELQGNR